MRKIFHRHASLPRLPAPDRWHGRRIPVVYVQPGYGPCRQTLDAFRAAGAEVEIVDVNSDEQARHDLKTFGYQQFPVVNTGRCVWTGHQPNRIAEFAESTLEEERSA